MLDFFLGGLLASAYVWHATGSWGIALFFFCMGMVIGIDIWMLSTEPKEPDND